MISLLFNFVQKQNQKQKTMKEFFNEVIKITIGVLIANILAQFISRMLKTDKSNYSDTEEDGFFEVE